MADNEQSINMFAHCQTLSTYRVTHLVANLGWVDLDLRVPPSCPTVQPLLPNSPPPRQNNQNLS